MTTQGRITHVVMHYSATYPEQDIGAAEIDKWHRDRGFARIGYHWVIRRDGRVEKGRDESQVGAHVRGMNAGKIGICVVGGLDRATGPNVGVDNRTPAQIAAQIKLTQQILARHPEALVVGHRDLVATQCPAYDAAAWWRGVVDRPLPSKPVEVHKLAQSEPQSPWARLLAWLLGFIRKG